MEHRSVPIKADNWTMYCAIFDCGSENDRPTNGSTCIAGHICCEWVMSAHNRMGVVKQWGVVDIMSCRKIPCVDKVFVRYWIVR